MEPPLPWFPPPSSPGQPLIRPLRLRRPGRRRSAVGRQQAGRVGACLGRGAPAPRVQRPLRGGCGAAVSSVRLRPLLGLSGRGRGEWDPNSPPGGRAFGGGTAPDLRRPSQWWKAPPPGTPFRHPHSEQRQPARAHAVGPVMGPHARTDRTRDTRVAKPWLPAPEDGRPGEEQRLTPDAPHNGGRPPPPGTAPHHPRGTQPPQGMQVKGTVLGPHTHTPAPTARGRRTPQPAQWAGSRGRDSA